MNPLFGRGPSIQTRMTLAVILSIVLIFVDHKHDGFKQVRVFLNSLVSPLQYAANIPQNLLDLTTTSLAFRSQLIEENDRLTEQHLILSERLQRMAFIERENQRLRALLKSPAREVVDKMVTEVMSVESNRSSQQVVINRGSLHGVYLGQPVLDDQGIVGQVISVGSTTSRVLLISDITHSIPIRVARNSVRSIASGAGYLQRMELNHVPHSADIKMGDLLVTSGLGGRFPEGYPVAKVSQVDSNPSLPFAKVVAEPVAKLERIRYLLLLWPPNVEQKPIFEAIEQIVEQAEELL
ncbi:rod shape-determining protein MreC [Saccharobesus litoralis]|uniref:Cell shape-determining protein MreC n=1 Tax=Saccharobesus litoralis TaxID=2172099 RepID=A0A2S0VX97_9ALTE|nr:rod shape-determining protein MreC [Saccharobesus litoralis]AWB68805.1 rod shape-determining protein MreC [Saccharobesus litoralis]